MKPPILIPFLLPLLLLLLLPITTPTGLVGISTRSNLYYFGDDKSLLTALQRMRVPRVRIIDPDMTFVARIAEAGAAVDLAVEKEATIVALATNRTYACYWTRNMYAATGRRVNLTGVSIGHNVLLDWPEMFDNVLVAFQNVRSALDDLGLGYVPVTTTHAYEVIQGVFPPSASKFDDRVFPQLRRLLEFMNRTNAPLELEMYPYKVLTDNAVPRAGQKFAMFEVDPNDEEVALTDSATGLRYMCILDMMMDSAVTALQKHGYGDLPLVVAGTGWPWRPVADVKPLSPFEDVHIAAEYNSRVIEVYNSRPGTPLRPTQPTVVFINGLTDGDESSENLHYSSFADHLGVLDSRDLSFKYNIQWPDTALGSGGSAGGAEPTTVMVLGFLFLHVGGLLL